MVVLGDFAFRGLDLEGIVTIEIYISRDRDLKEYHTSEL